MHSNILLWIQSSAAASQACARIQCRCAAKVWRISASLPIYKSIRCTDLISCAGITMCKMRRNPLFVRHFADARIVISSPIVSNSALAEAQDIHGLHRRTVSGRDQTLHSGPALLSLNWPSCQFFAPSAALAWCRSPG
jgi:hypothetical protein